MASNWRYNLGAFHRQRVVFVLCSKSGGKAKMPTPFPGMDPYLESADIWPGFHHRLANEL